MAISKKCYIDTDNCTYYFDSVSEAMRWCRNNGVSTRRIIIRDNWK